MIETTRFAPSPTGRLHLGHAYSALFAYNKIFANGGRFIVRIEDIDPTRCKAEFEEGIFEDLRWLGLTWEIPVRCQSKYIRDYEDALGKLHAQDLLYPCFCSRKDIKDEIERAGVAPHGPEGALYPGTCKNINSQEQEDRIAAGEAYAFRLDMNKALKITGNNLEWHDEAKGTQTATPDILGDVVLARKDISTSYHLSVTVDDHIQGITTVTRGEDLFYATHLHRLLQELLGLNVPKWHHHGLLLDENGKRFAKRNKAVTLEHLRKIEKKTPRDIQEQVGIILPF